MKTPPTYPILIFLEIFVLVIIKSTKIQYPGSRLLMETLELIRVYLNSYSNGSARLLGKRLPEFVLWTRTSQQDRFSACTDFLRPPCKQ